MKNDQNMDPLERGVRNVLDNIKAEIADHKKQMLQLRARLDVLEEQEVRLSLAIDEGVRARSRGKGMMLVAEPCDEKKPGA